MLDAGALQLVVEARESAAGVGLFDDAGRFNAAYADQSRTLSPGRGVFEAPTKPSQFRCWTTLAGKCTCATCDWRSCCEWNLPRALHSDAFEKENLARLALRCPLGVTGEE